MRFLILLLSLVAFASVKGQVDTIFLAPEKLADTLYNNLAGKAPTGYLSNKLSVIETDSLLLKTGDYSASNTSKSVDADKMLQWLYEMNCMSVGTDTLPEMDTVFTRAFEYVGEMDFEEDMAVIPFGILSLKFNSIDETAGISSGTLSRNVSIWTDNNVADNSIVSEHSSLLAGPFFDYVTTDKMGLVVKRDFVIGNLLDPDSISSMAFERNGVWKNMDFEQIALFQPYPDSIQSFRFKLVYGGDTLVFPFHLNTPDLYDSIKPKSGENLWGWDWDNDQDQYDDMCGSPWNPGCTNCGHEGNGACKLKWCYIPACSRENYINAKPEKPYIVVTGYRPPMFGQGFKKTWTLYNDNHANLLQDLRDNDFDIILVKFNMAAKPFQHGLQEAATLFEDFILYLNADFKTGDYFENVIQANSMGEDIVRLALLTMEKKHFTVPGYPHHRSRLNIAYDANLYGANIPLGYQYQVVSAFKRHSMVFGVAPFFLSSFLYATIMQKAFKELITYHATATDESIFNQNNYQADIVPTHHWRRQSFLDALQAVDNGKYFIPMPGATRNISVSLGKISGKNNEPESTEPGDFHDPGERWQDWDILGIQFRISAAKYTQPGEYHQLFKRQVPAVFYNPFATNLKHQIGVSQMDEIDNSAGSYMNKIGNFIAVCDWTYFPLSQIWNGRNFYTHKPVVSALAINSNLWPTDHSMSVDVQQLGLMFEGYNSINQLRLSEHVGYPNLGRPSDHFAVTPFEAIYVDDKIDPHIDLKDADASDKDSLNTFLYNEAEPWYLYLQNQEVGTQARADYEYYVRRRARNVITVGHLITASTDPGDYNSHSNAKLDLRAGDAIILKPGTHLMAGSNDHLKIEFDDCGSKSLVQSDDDQNNSENDGQPASSEPQGEKMLCVLFPNPTRNGSFTIRSLDATNILSMSIFSISGTTVINNELVNLPEYNISAFLSPGTYIIKVMVANQIETHKLVVL